MEDKATKDYVAFFQADNVKIVEVALRKAIEKSNTKERGKESIKKQIDKFKNLAKENPVKDIAKVKDKNIDLDR